MASAQKDSAIDDTPATDASVCQLGDHERGVVIVAPTNPTAVAVLRKLNILLKKRTVKKALEGLIEKGDTSVRQIQAERFEIFIEASSKGCTAFELITKDMPSDTKVQLMLASETPRCIMCLAQFPTTLKGASA